MKLLCALPVLFLTALPALSQPAPDPCATAPASCATLLNTHAIAQTRIPNTAADVELTVTVSDKDMPTVQRALSDRSAQLLTWLRAQHVTRLLTTAVNFQPDTKPQKNALDKTVGYTGTTTVTFRTTPDKAPELLAAALDHGASNIDSTSFSPTEEEVAAAQAELSAQATRIAIAQADAIAKAAGLHVVSIRNISVQNNGIISPRPMPMMQRTFKADMAAAPAIETAPGDQSLSMRVDLTAAATH